MADDKEAIVETYMRYFTAFQRLDPRAVVAYYHIPCLLVSTSGVIAMASGDEIEAQFGRLMQGLRARGYGRSELNDVQIRRLGARVVSLTISGARYRGDGTHLEPLGATYTMHKTDDEWQIVVTTLHDPDSVTAQE